jgi:hypothetical protein
MIIALYEPVTWEYASGSVVDVVVSVAGAGLGVWVGMRADRAGRTGRADRADVVSQTSLEGDHEEETHTS